MLVEEREVGGHDDFPCADPAPVSDRRGADQFPHRGVLVDVQALGKGRDEFQWVELGLV